MFGRAAITLRIGPHSSYKPVHSVGKELKINMSSCLNSLFCHHCTMFLCGSTVRHPFNGLFCRTTWLSWHQRLNQSEFSWSKRWWGGSGSGISWTLRKSFAPRSRQITASASHHSVFLQAGCYSWRPTNSVKAMFLYIRSYIYFPCLIPLNLRWMLIVIYDYFYGRHA